MSFFRKRGNKVPKNKLQAVCGLRYAKNYFFVLAYTVIRHGSVHHD